MMTPRTRLVLNLAARDAQALSPIGVIEPEHLLLGILREGDSVAVRILGEFGVSPRPFLTILLQAIQAGLGGQESVGGRSGTFASSTRDSSTAPSESKTPTLDQFSRDLTEMAREGRFDPVIGRGDEIRRVEQILCRRTKNNPVLIGEPGVGKTAIAEGIGAAYDLGRYARDAFRETPCLARSQRYARRIKIQRRIRRTPQDGNR